MANKLKSYKNKIYNRWLILDLGISKNTYICFCICGNSIKELRRSSVMTGGSKSCGCIFKETAPMHGFNRRTGNYARTRGTLAYFKTNTWGSIQKRTINKKPDSRNKSYIRKGIMCLMSKDEFYNWCDKQQNIIMSLYKEDKTPSINRINDDGHYELNNIEIIDKKLNILLSSKNPKNIKARVDAANKAKYKKVYLIHPNGNEEFFNGIKFAALKYNLRASDLSQILNNKALSHKGFKIKYV